MLDKHLIALMRPMPNEKNVVFWKNYRVTVLGVRLFRMEYSEKRRFCDEATLSVFYRDMPPVAFSVKETARACEIVTNACRFALKEKREECRILLDGKCVKISYQDKHTPRCH